MNLTEIERHLTRWYRDGVSVHLESEPGVGKSSIMAAAPQIVGSKLGLNLGIVVVNGAMLTPMHVLGFGVVRHHENWSQMIFTDPFFMTTDEGKRLTEYDGGWIFVDESDKADTDVKKVLGEGALSGRFGPHRLPPGWRVWTAGNRAQDRSGSTKELDHLINRRKRINVTPSVTALIDWMNRNGALPVTKTFVETYPNVVFSGGVPEKQGPWATPRSMMLVDRTLQFIIEDYGAIPDEEFVVEEIDGLIGSAATAQFMAHVRLELKLPKFEQIIADPTGTEVPGPDAPDARMLVAYNVAHRVTKETVAKAIAYIKRLPDPFAVTFMKAMATRAPMLLLTPEAQAWGKENRTLMTLMHTLQAPK